MNEAKSAWLSAEQIHVSALNQYSYCPRRWALIYQECTFTDNIHTQRGNAEHERADRVDHTTTVEGARLEFALPIWSDRLGLVGRCDVVEFHPDGTIYPVEYKHGSFKRWENDDLQLVAQGMCLEEMFGKPVQCGAIFHYSSRKRRTIEISDTLRHRVEQTISAIRRLQESSVLPLPINNQRCGECSLREACLPHVSGNASKNKRALKELFAVDGD